MKNYFLLFVISFLSQFTGSNSGNIEIKNLSIKSCFSLPGEGKKFMFVFNVDYEFFSIDEMFEIPLKRPNYVNATCKTEILQYVLFCEINATNYPIINENITLDTSITQIGTINLIWKLSEEDLYQGDCYENYTHIFNVNNNDENPQCFYHYNTFNIYGTFKDVINNSLNSPLLNNFPIEFKIHLDGNRVPINCSLSENEGLMKCFVKGNGTASFFRTIAKSKDDNSKILIDQSFKINLKDCKAKVIEITEINSVKCGYYSFMQKNFTFKLMANFINVSNVGDFYLPLKNPSNVKAKCSPQISENYILCEINVVIYPLINEKVIIDTSFDKINDTDILWIIANPEIYEGICAPNYIYQFTEIEHDENTICQYGYNTFNIIGVYNNISSNNRFIQEQIEGFNVGFVINVDQREEIVSCNLNDIKGKMLCSVKGKGKATFLRTIALSHKDQTLILLNQSFQIELQECQISPQFKIIEIASINTSTCNINKERLEFILNANFINILNMDYFYLLLGVNNNIKANCSSQIENNYISCSINVKKYPIIDEKILLDTSFNKINDIIIKWNIINPEVFDGNCAPYYYYTYKVYDHDNKTICETNYNTFNIYYDIQYSKGNNNIPSLLTEDNQIKFTIDIDGEENYIKCNIYEYEEKMKCFIDGRGNAKFFITLADYEDMSRIILIKQSFQIKLKQCPEDYSSLSETLKFVWLLALILSLL